MIIRVNTTYLKKDLLRPSVIFSGLTSAVIYILFSVLFMNYRLIGETILGPYPFMHKAILLLSLPLGITTLYTIPEVVLLLLMGFLMGINLSLILTSLPKKQKRTTSEVKNKRDWTFGFGIIGVVASTGCASCGITLLSFLGPTVSVGLLPFQGIVLQGISLFLLLLSLLYTINRRNANCIIARA